VPVNKWRWKVLWYQVLQMIEDLPHNRQIPFIFNTVWKVHATAMLLLSTDTESHMCWDMQPLNTLNLFMWLAMMNSSTYHQIMQWICRVMILWRVIYIFLPVFLYWNCLLVTTILLIDHGFTVIKLLPLMLYYFCFQVS
jgi:hypothetical protein